MDEGQSEVLRVLTLDGGGAKGFYTLGVLTHIYHASKYKKPHQWVTRQKTFQWHYIWLFAASSGHFLHAAGGE